MVLDVGVIGRDGIAAGAKARRFIIAGFSARLKSCPDTYKQVLARSGDGWVFSKVS